MNSSEYQELASRTLNIPEDFKLSRKELEVLWNAVGIAGESGEFLDMIKKGIFHRHGIDEDNVKKELGDICWYVAAICTVMGFDLGEILEMNIDKLKKRYPDGFSFKKSINR